MVVSPPEVWSDLDHRLIVDAQGTLKKVINEDSVATSIDNILRTRKGERVMLPEFGSSLHNILFENISDALLDSIADDIRIAINTWDDRVIVNSVDFQQRPDRNFIGIKMFFTIRGYDQVFEHTTTV